MTFKVDQGHWQWHNLIDLISFSIVVGCNQGRLHHRKLGANAPKKFQGGGRFDVEPGGDVFEKKYLQTT